MWANEFERSRLVRFDPVSRHTRHNRRLPFPSSLQNAIRTGQLILLLDDARMITAPVVSQRNGELQTSALERESLMFRTTIERAMKHSSFSSGRVSRADTIPEAPMSFADSIAVNNKYLLGEDKQAKEKQYCVDLQCVWDNGESVGEIPLLLTFDTGEVQRHTLPANGHLVVEGAPSASYKAQLKPDEDDTSALRISIQETLAAIIEKEKAEAAMHQSLQDQMDVVDNVVVHTGAVMWGVWNWAKDTVEALNATAKLVTPAGNLSRALQASYAASQAGPESTWQETFLKSYSDQQHEDFLKALGFDPLQITKAQLAEAYEIANFVYEDAPTRAALTKFSEDYVKAQDSVELAESLAPAVLDIILTVVLTATTAVGGTVIVARAGQSLFRQLGRLLVSLGKALKKSELSKHIVSKLSNKPERFEIRRPQAQKLSEPKRVERNGNDGTMGGQSVVPGTELLRVKPGTLRGEPELPHPNANADMVRSLNRQNESAEILSNRGFDVTHLPNTGRKGGNPDLDINGRAADVYSPKSKNPNTIRDNMIHKVEHQAPDIVLNITDSPLSVEDMLRFLDQKPVSGLQNLYLIDGENVLLRMF